MPSKAQLKRYNNRQAQNLLARIVAFAEGPTPAAIHRDLQRLLTDICAAGPYVAFFETGPSTSEIATLQRRLRTFFRDVVTRRDNDEGAGIIPELRLASLAFGVRPIRHDLLLTVDGAASDVLVFQVLTVLRIAGLERLRRCESTTVRPTVSVCDRIFARKGRGEYCSVKCQKRMQMRNARKYQWERLRYGKKTRTR